MVARGLKIPKDCDTSKKRTRDAFDLEECEAIEKNADNIFFADVVAILINTGLREGELLALRGKSIDIQNSCVHVTNAATRKNGKPMLGKVCGLFRFQMKFSSFCKFEHQKKEMRFSLPPKTAIL